MFKTLLKNPNATETLPKSRWGIVFVTMVTMCIFQLYKLQQFLSNIMDDGTDNGIKKKPRSIRCFSFCTHCTRMEYFYIFTCMPFTLVAPPTLF